MSRRGRWLAVAGAGLVALAAGAMPVLLSGKPLPSGAPVHASGQVSPTTGAQDGLSPGDEADPGTTGPPSSTSTTGRATTTTGAQASTTSTTFGNGCASRTLAMSVTTDRATYRPGDTIDVAISVVNQSDLPCWVTDRGGSTGGTSACDPQVVVHRYDDADDYNALLGPVFGPCGDSVFTTLNPGDGLTRHIMVPFTSSATGLRAGSWTILVTWLTAGISPTDPGKSAQITVACPADACTPAPPTTATTATATTSG